MIRYEILMLTVPEITEDEGKKIHAELDKIIRADKGSVISFERWGKYRLAYPIEKNEYGVYFLARFEVPEVKDVLTEVKRAFRVRLNDVVIRHMIVALDADQSLEYQRPLSLEETPEREVGAFLKDHKVQGFLKGEGRGRRGPRREYEGQPRERAEVEFDEETA